MEMVKRNGAAPPPLPDLAAQAAAKASIEVARLVIVLRGDGSIQILGPANEKLMCYGMLEAAKIAIAAQGNSPILGV